MTEQNGVERSTAAETLRAMLDERGVEWFESVTRKGLTWIYRDGKAIRFHPWQPDTLKVTMFDLTPEQAVAATLGDAPRLPYFWTADGTLHIELPRLPESISVRLPDQRDREVGSARTWQYMRDNGTCKAVYLLMATDIGDGREEVLGAYATESAAMKAISENKFGYAFHHARKWEVDE